MLTAHASGTGGAFDPSIVGGQFRLSMAGSESRWGSSLAAVAVDNLENCPRLWPGAAYFFTMERKAIRQYELSGGAQVQ